MAYLRKISFWYLTLFVLFSVGHSFQAALTFSSSSDHAIFQANGLGSVFVVCLAAGLALDLAASYYVIRPSPVGFWVILAALGFAATYNVLVFSLAFSDLESAKSAYLVSREVRGLTTRPEATELVFSEQGMRATVGVAVFLAFSSLCALAINWSRFFRSESDA